jgi:hypothetical protein
MAILRTASTNWTGLAADTKPTTGVPTGSTFLETDTGLIYYWNGTAWSQTGGGGAGDMLLGTNQTVTSTKTFDTGGKIVMQGTPTNLYIHPSDTVDTTTSGYPLKIEETITTTPTTSAPDMAALLVDATYNATQVTDPFDLTYTGIQSTLKYGTSGSPKGTVSSFTSTLDIQGSGSTSNEFVNYFGWQRAQNGSQVRHWFTDWNLHGPIGTQPNMLTGINMLINNYYNGSPSGHSSYGMSIMTAPATGGGATAAHLAATSYKLDFGIGVQGYGGTAASPTTGYDIGLKIGGTNVAWITSVASKITTGIKLIDIESTGIDLGEPATSASSPVGLKNSNSTRAWDIFIDLSGNLAPTTAALKVGLRNILFNTMKLFEQSAQVIAMQPTAADVAPFLNIMSGYSAAVTDPTVRSYIRMYATNSILNTEYLQISIEGTSGAVFSTRNQGTGTVRGYVFRVFNTDILTFNSDFSVNMNSRILSNVGAITMTDAKDIAVGTTTGTKIGTATTQKIGFWNKTPVVQPAANADTSGATLTALETEVNELKALLRSIGLMA